MTDEGQDDDLTTHERELFEALPRDSEPASAATERLVSTLRHDGYLRRSPLRPHWAFQAAAAIALLVIGSAIGATAARRGSLEQELARTDLGVAERVLLLQRAGSAYVTAAHSYANATAAADSSAVEVANQVLRGAAYAVMQSKLNGPLSTSLVAALQAPSKNPPKPIFWY